MSERTLKEIALYILEMYEDAKETVIYEYSGSIDADLKELKAKVSEVRQGIEEMAPDRKQGIWMGSVCSACGQSTPNYYDCEYCPHCGAEMRGE